MPASFSIYAGTDPVVLNAMLAEALDVYRQVVLGKRVASGAYSQGAGSKSVTFGELNLVQLKVEIGQIQLALGLTQTFGRRRAIGVRF